MSQSCHANAAARVRDSTNIFPRKTGRIRLAHFVENDVISHEPVFFKIGEVFWELATESRIDIDESRTCSSEGRNMSQYGDFTVYIFASDFVKLRSLDTGKSGSLYGLWTSTLNPVIHVVYKRDSYHRGPGESQVRTALTERYKMSYLGEWRNVTPGEARVQLYPQTASHRPGQFYRFLVLDIIGDKVQPYMYDSPTVRAPKTGAVDILQGDNPFDDDGETRAILSGKYSVRNTAALVDVPTGAEAYERYYEQERRDRRAQPARNQRARAAPPAADRQTQWYSENGGEANLKLVYENIKEIADGDVQMTRDKTTQDMSLSCRISGQEWTVAFPSRFPQVGAELRRRGQVVLYTSESSIIAATFEIRRAVSRHRY